MDAGIVAAMITGGLSLIGVIVTNIISNNKMQNKIEVSLAITDTKITQLKESVDKHNSFATRIPVLENEITNIKAELNDIKKGN